MDALTFGMNLFVFSEENGKISTTLPIRAIRGAMVQVIGLGKNFSGHFVLYFDYFKELPDVL